MPSVWLGVLGEEVEAFDQCLLEGHYHNPDPAVFVAMITEF
jgi:hypothetical protein